MDMFERFYMNEFSEPYYQNEFLDKKKRIETGKVQFGDDWSGIFIRGDNVAGYYLPLTILKTKITEGKEIDNFDMVVIDNLINLFGKVHEDVNVLKLKDIKECVIDE